MIASPSATKFVLASALVSALIFATTGSVLGAGNAPPLPGPYQSLQFMQPGAVFAQPQVMQQSQNSNFTTNPSTVIDTFPTHSFAMPYWMQTAPGNGQRANTPQMNAGSNQRPNQFPQNNTNNGGRGYNSNMGGYFQPPASEFFPAYGSGFGPNGFGINTGGNGQQGYQNNGAPVPTNAPQGNFGPPSNWGGQFNGFGYGQAVNPWGGSNYPSPNGFNFGRPFSSPNTMQR